MNMFKYAITDIQWTHTHTQTDIHVILPTALPLRRLCCWRQRTWQRKIRDVNERTRTHSNISLVSLIYLKSMETGRTCSRGGWPDGWRGARTTACCSPWGPAGSVAWAEWRILDRGHCPGCPPSPERSGRHQGCGWTHWGPKGMLCYLGQRKHTHKVHTQRNKAMGFLSYLR